MQSRLATAGCHVRDGTGCVTPPIHMTSTFDRNPEYKLESEFMYGRIGNPTRGLLEQTMADLEGGKRACAFGSGMAAAAAILQAMSPGDVVVMADDVYHGVMSLLRQVFIPWGLVVKTIDMTDARNVRVALEQERYSNAKKNVFVWMETPSNPLCKVSPLAAICSVARQFDAVSVVDSTWTTPVLTRPLEHGADLVLHSTTKYLGGHSDVIGGLVVGGVSERANYWMSRVALIQGCVGAVPSPFDCWLVLRGIRSLAARMRMHSENALIVAEALQADPRVHLVHYPGLPHHPQHSIAMEQMKGGFGGMLSFEVVGGANEALQVCSAVRLFRRATSLGGTESLIEHRRSIEPPGTTTPLALLRLSIGLESPADLVQDLTKALDTAVKPRN